MAKIFVSYSRKDIEFAKKLTNELQKNELDFWVDWEGIPPTVDWWRQIEKGIEEADVFLFLISPDSATSKICGQEINCAVKNSKRIIPLVVRDTKGDESPKQLSHINWIFFREQDDFTAALEKLLTGIHTDYDWVQNHRRLQVKSLEWERNNKDNGFLLHGKDLLDAETNLAVNTSKEPHPTDLQRHYVLQSRKATDKQRRLVTGFSVAGLITLAILAVFGFYQASVATKQVKISRAGELAAQAELLIDRDFHSSLLLGIESSRLLDNIQTRGALLDTSSASPQLLQYLTEHTSPVLSVVFSPDGKTLTSSSVDKTIITWDVSTMLNTSTVTRKSIDQPPTGDADMAMSMVMSVALSLDGKTLASGSDDKTITLWNVETGQPISQPLTRHTDMVMSVAFSPDGKTLASGSDDKTIILWNVETHEPIGQPLTGRTSAIYSLAFSPDGKTLASGNEDGTIILWDVATRQPISQPLAGHTSAVYSLAFSPDGKILASGNGDSTIILWDISTMFSTSAEIGQRIGQPLTGHGDKVYSVAFSPDGKTLASGSGDSTVILWDVSSILNTNVATHQSLSQQLNGHKSSVLDTAFSPDGQTLASGYDDNTIIFWDIATHQPIGQPLTGHKDAVNDVTFSPDGKTLASGSDDKTIILWDVATRQPIGQPLIGHTDTIYSVAFSPDGKILASGSYDKTIILWDVATGQPIGQPLTGHTGWVMSVAFSPDGKTLASGSADTAIILWDVATHQPIGQPLTGRSNYVNSVAFSPDGKILASGNGDATIVLWDAATHQPIGQPLTGHSDYVNGVSFSPDGKILASGSADNAVILWDVAASKPIGQPLIRHTDWIYSVEFSPDGKTLVSGSRDNTIVLWDVDIQSWIAQSCQRAGRNFTRAEWEKYFPTEEYRKTCEQWRLEPELTSTQSMMRP